MLRSEAAGEWRVRHVKGHAERRKARALWTLDEAGNDATDKIAGRVTTAVVAEVRQWEERTRELLPRSATSCGGGGSEWSGRRSRSADIARMVGAESGTGSDESEEEAGERTNRDPAAEARVAEAIRLEEAGRVRRAARARLLAERGAARRLGARGQRRREGRKERRGRRRREREAKAGRQRRERTAGAGRAGLVASATRRRSLRRGGTLAGGASGGGQSEWRGCSGNALRWLP